MNQSGFRQLTKENIQSVLPLTPLQEGMLFHSLLDTDDRAYVQQMRLALDGSIDIDAFKASWNSLIARHEALRTAFQSHKTARPVQIVMKSNLLEFRHIEAGGGSFESFVDQIARDERAERLQLEFGQTMRLALVSKSPGQHTLIWTFHHIIMDGWCLGIIHDELFKIYDALISGKQHNLPPAAKFSDYLKWIEKIDPIEGENFWKDYLDGLEGVSELPSTVRSQNSRSRIFDSHWIEIDEEQTAALTALARELRITLSSLIHGLWSLLLERYSDRGEIVFGSTLALRPPELRGVERMVGLLINTLPVRMRIAPETIVSDHLKAVHENYRTIERFAHKSLADIQSLSGVAGALFNHILVFENLPPSRTGSAMLLPGVKILSSDMIEQTNYALEITVFPGEKLTIRFSFDESTLSKQDASRIGSHLSNLIKGVISKPHGQLSSLDVLTPEERELVSQASTADNIVEFDPTRPIPIIEQIERFAASKSAGVAVVASDRTLTFEELSHESWDRCGALTGSYALQPGDVACLVLPRTSDLIPTILGIWKAGGAYVPIDPRYPSDRISYIFDHVEPKVIITTDALKSTLEALTDRPIVSVEELRYRDIGRGQRNPVATDGDPTAYIIYTSGSTGKPKGVAIRQSNLSAFLPNMTQIFGLGPDDTLLAMTTYTFDISLLELTLTLASGMTVVLGEEVVTTSPERIASLMREHSVTALQITPSHLRILLETSEENLLSGLKTLLIGGEALPADLWELVRTRTAARVFNVYGPTETTIWSTAAELTDGEITIGRALLNEWTCILDSHTRLTPVGVEGDIYIGGYGVGSGYHKLPGQTASVFIPDPFHTGMTLYKTGDRGKLLDDGSIRFLGRKDHQIKVRGFRVEAGEIETAIKSITGSPQCVVVKGSDRFSEDLIAYYTGARIDEIELRESLASTLPDYMVPAYFIPMTEFPLTPSGKIDRKSLPQPAAIIDDRPAGSKQGAVRNRFRDLILQITGRSRLDWDESFFEAGGHSLKAMRLAAALRKEFNVEIELQDIFENHRFEQLYGLLSTRQPSQIPWIEPSPIRDDYPISAEQKQIWLIDSMQGESPEYNMPGAVRISGSIDEERLLEALEVVVRDREILRTSFHLKNGQPRQRVEDSAAIDFETIDLADVSVDQMHVVAKMMEGDTTRPFDLTRAPLFRARLFRLSETDFIFYLNIHHILADAQSVSIFFRDLLAAYHSDREKIHDKPKLQYRDFALWQEKLAQSELYRQQESYWLNRFETPSPPLNLPSDYLIPEGSIRSAAHETISFDRVLHSDIRGFCRRHETTLFTFLAGIAHLQLYRYTDQDDITVGVPVSLRIHPDLEDQIGYFVNTLPIQSRVEGWQPFASFLKEYKANLNQALANRLYPFESLVEKLRTRSSSEEPLYRVLVVFDDVITETFETGGLRVEPVPLAEQTAKFDLIYHFRAGDEDLTASLIYNKTRWRPSSVNRFLSHFNILIRGVLDNDQLALDRLPLMPESERQLVTAGFNSSRADLAGGTLLDLIEERVKEHPEKIAIRFEGVPTSYTDLDARANSIARRILETTTIEQDEVIALYAHRSEAAIAAILGILKAGAAFLPIDDTLPDERVKTILEDSGCKLVLAHDSSSRLRFDAAIPFLEIGLSEAGIPPLQSRRAGRSDLAYVIYTSGTTGRPKGVAVEHKAIMTTVIGQSHLCLLTSEDVVVSIASLSFDASVMEILMTLAYGATLIPVPREILLDPLRMGNLMRTEKVSYAILTPGYIAALDREALSGLKTLLSVAEAARSEDAAWFASRINYFNGYGPTETAVCSTIYHINGPLDTTIVPIGTALPNTRILILDKNRQPVPIGIPGEMFLGGDNLARGYYKRDQMTAEKFVPDPVNPGERLYRSGDLALWQEDGNILYLGRADTMVKVRGFRIELSEIEQHLDRHESVARSVVMVNGSGSDARLIAYVIPAGLSGGGDAGKTTVNLSGLKKYLRDLVPPYMIPEQVIPIDSVPLTANGKIDYRALPPAQTVSVEPVEESGMTGIQRAILDIWRDVLHSPGLRLRDDFFENGGNSLKAIQLILGVKAALGIEVSTRELFESPTAEGFSARLAEMEGTQQSRTRGRQNAGDDADQTKLCVTVTATPLEDAILAGDLPRLDAAAFGYYTDAILENTGVGEREFLERAGHDPILSDLIKTPFGNIGYVVLPRFTSSLYREREELLSEIIRSVELVRALGARSISLTGLIPSATGYGQAILDRLAGSFPDVSITTGHATTAATVVKTIERVLSDLSRPLEEETVAFLGLGSVGTTLLGALFSLLSHPKRLVLCDIESKRGDLEGLKRGIKSDYGFGGEVEILVATPNLPIEFYSSSMYIGATNVPGILDVSLLPAGSVVIDDSGPHCFSESAAFERMKDKADIVASEGGYLKLSQDLNVTAYINNDLQNEYRRRGIQPYKGFNPRHLTGCVLSGLLTVNSSRLRPTIGLPSIEECRNHYHEISDVGLSGGDPQLSGYYLKADYLHEFSRNFLHNTTGSRRK